MYSATKRQITVPQLKELLRRMLGPDAQFPPPVELPDGAFNTVYAVDLADGRNLVLKLAPTSEPHLLRYEVDLMHAEIEFYRLAAPAGVPLPTVHAADPDLGYLLIDRLTGESLYTAKARMTPTQLAQVRFELGTICRRLRTVTGPHFGYPRRDGRTQSASWRTSFLAFLDDILADAAEYRRELPAPGDTVRKLVLRHADLLDQVDVPALVHFDLWDGNVFVVPDDEDGFRVEGIIDGERAFYGDPLAELVSLALFTEPAEQPGLLAGYLGRELTEPERTRLRLYTVYLYLIMVTEGATREFDPIEHEPLRRHVLDLLDTELSHL